MGIINHKNKTDLLIQVLKDSSNRLLSFTDSFLEESNNIENICHDLLNDRNIDSAIGVQLDHIGYLVGEYRESRTDEDFRKAIKLRISINTSQGTINDIYSVINLLYGESVETTVIRTGKCLLSIFIGIEEPSENLIPLLEQTIPVGVKIDTIVYSNSRLPWIPVESGGVIQDTGILPERGEDSPNVRIPPERINV